MLYRTNIGLDVHARSISCAAFIPETGEIIEREFGYEPSSIAGWVTSLPQPVRCVYESGPTGFDLLRKLNDLGVECCIGAVSKMLRPSGDKVKTDKRDAVFLARMLAVGNIVEIDVPSVSMEAARDLSRAREDCRADLMRARHLLSKFLLRKGYVYEKRKSAWTQAHRKWLKGLVFEEACERVVFEEYLEAICMLEAKRDRLDKAISKRASEQDLAPIVSALRCLRGISDTTAFSIAAEIGDFSRFANARSFMSYIGLVPSERSSGESVCRGGITRTGNAHVRTLLIEAAWHHARTYDPLSYTFKNAVSKVEGRIADEASKANLRLHRRCEHLRRSGKPSAVANAAIARELSGFVWSLAMLAA